MNGLVWGYMFYKSESLWTPIISHFITNTILNIVHVNSDNGLDSSIMIRNIVASNFFVLSMLLIKHFCEKYIIQSGMKWIIDFED